MSLTREQVKNTIKELGKTPVPFSALVGDHHNYWFLNSKNIDERKICE